MEIIKGMIGGLVFMAALWYLNKRYIEHSIKKTVDELMTSIKKESDKNKANEESNNR